MRREPNHMHTFLISHICVEWIDANVARDTPARERFRLLDIMLPFANYELAMREDELPTIASLYVARDEVASLEFTSIELGFKHEQN